MVDATKELFPKREQPMSDSCARFVSAFWPKIEQALRRWPQARRLRSGSGKNDRLEAWLSDCAQALCEHREDDLIQTIRESLKLTTGHRWVIRGYWRRIFKILAFRRSVMGWDVAEVCKDSEVVKAKRYYSDAFWMQIPQNEKPEYDLESKKRTFFKMAAKLAGLTKKDEGLIEVLAALIECPDLVHSAQAEAIGVSDRTFYRRLSTLRTRMVCGAAWMAYCEGDE